MQKSPVIKMESDEDMKGLNASFDKTGLLDGKWEKQQKKVSTIKFY